MARVWNFDRREERQMPSTYSTTIVSEANLCTNDDFVNLCNQ